MENCRWTGIIVSILLPQIETQTEPRILLQLGECAGIQDDRTRLACFDARFSELQTARNQGDVVIVDRDGLSQARRQFFGFQVARLPSLFGDEQQALQAIETTLARARREGDGRWVFHLADGAEWRQIDSDPVRFRNAPGQPVRVRSATMGSYQMTIGDSRAVRVRRQ